MLSMVCEGEEHRPGWLGRMLPLAARMRACSSGLPGVWS